MQIKKILLAPLQGSVASEYLSFCIVLKQAKLCLYWHYILYSINKIKQEKQWRLCVYSVLSIFTIWNEIYVKKAEFYYYI